MAMCHSVNTGQGMIWFGDINSVVGTCNFLYALKKPEIARKSYVDATGNFHNA